MTRVNADIIKLQIVLFSKLGLFEAMMYHCYKNWTIIIYVYILHTEYPLDYDSEVRHVLDQNIITINLECIS